MAHSMPRVSVGEGEALIFKQVIFNDVTIVTVVPNAHCSSRFPVIKAAYSLGCVRQHHHQTTLIRDRSLPGPVVGHITGIPRE
jgi:hypothetical protein